MGIHRPRKRPEAAKKEIFLNDEARAEHGERLSGRERARNAARYSDQSRPRKVARLNEEEDLDVEELDVDELDVEEFDQDEEGVENTESVLDRQVTRSSDSHFDEDKPKKKVARPSKKEDDFDLNDFTSSTGVLREKKSVTVKLTSYLDSRNYYRVHPDDKQESVYCCECKDEDNASIFYLVSEDVAEDVEVKTGGELKLMTLARLLDSTGAEFIYLAAEPDPSRSDRFNKYATTRAEFLEKAQDSWASLQNNKDAYRYEVKLAGERTQKMFDVKEFSSRSFTELIKEVFAGRIVRSEDHPLLQEEDI